MVDSLGAQSSIPERAPRPLFARPDVTSTSAGVVLVLAGVMLFSVSDVLAKQLSRTLPSPEITWLRYLTLSIVAVVLAAPRGVSLLKPTRPGLQVLRGLASLGSAAFFLLSLGRMGVAEATAISFVAPALITCLSIPLLGERVGWRRWAATLVGLAGVLIVVRPGGGVFGPAALVPLASAICGALAVIVTRKMGAGARARTTLLWSALIGLFLLTLSAGAWFEPPTTGELWLGLAMGSTYAVGQLLMILAYRQSEASLLAPFTYAQILSSGLLGFVVLGAIPGAATLVGMLVILMSGAYTLRRERVVRRTAYAARA